MGIKVDEKGREIFDPTPMELPLGFTRPEPIEMTIRRMVQVVSDEAGKQGLETEEEADDFNIDDDPPDPLAPWEYSIDDEIAVREARIKSLQKKQKMEEEEKEFLAWQKAKQAKPAAQEPVPNSEGSNK